VEELEARDPKDRAVQGGHPVDRPVLGQALQVPIDLGPVRCNALHELPGERVDRFADPLPTLQDEVGIRAGDVGLVEDVEGLAPGLSAGGHGPHLTRSM
jgi:hypothetical protein